MTILGSIVIWLGGLGLLVFGLRELSVSLQAFLGPHQVIFFSWLSRSRILAFFIGAFISITALFPSSVLGLSIGYMSAGLLSSSLALSLAIGIQFGSFFIPLILVMSEKLNGFAFIGIGALPYIFSRSFNRFALFFISLGLVIVGFEYMSYGVELMQIAFSSWSGFLLIESDVYFFIGIFCGLILSILFKATHIVFFLALTSIYGGVISLNLALGLMIGETVAYYGDFFKNKNLVRVEIKHTGLYLLFTIFFSILIMFFLKESVFGFSEKIALNFQSYNTTLLTLLLSFICFVHIPIFFLFLIEPGLIVLKKMIFSKNKIPHKLKYFDCKFGFLSFLSLELANQEVKKMAAMIHTILNLTSTNSNPLDKTDELTKKIEKYEQITDNILIEVKEFLANFLTERLNKEQSLKVTQLLNITENLEAIADLCKFLSQTNTFHRTIDKKEVNDQLVSVLESLNRIYEVVLSDLLGYRRQELSDFKIEAENFFQKISALKKTEWLQNDKKNYPIFFAFLNLFEKIKTIEEVQKNQLIKFEKVYSLNLLKD